MEKDGTHRCTDQAYIIRVMQGCDDVDVNPVNPHRSDHGTRMW